MANSDSSNSNNDGKSPKQSNLSVTVENQPVPKLPHERDESVESQEGGPKPGTANSNTGPGVKPRVKTSGSKNFLAH